MCIKHELPEPRRYEWPTNVLSVFLCIVGVLAATTAHAAIPLMINHQGLVKVNSLPFSGNGLFKFGFLDASNNWLWTNDGSHLGQSAGITAPDAGVTLPVNNGIYNVRLGDTSFANMASIPSTVFDGAEVKLRILFNDGVNNWQTLSPDQPVTATGYAYHAATADNAVHLEGLTAEQVSVPVGFSVLGTTSTPPEGYSYSGRSIGGGWLTGANLPDARLGMGTAWSNGFVYAIGGEISGGFVSTNAAYDPIENAWSAKAAMPTAREFPAAAEVNGIIYVIGGFTPSILATNEAYNTTTNTWSTKAPMPTARRKCAAAVVNGIIYVIGGNDGSADVKTNEAYDPIANTWTSKALMPTSRNGFGVGVVNGIIYAIGGTAGGANEAYDPVSNTWSIKASLPTPRYYLATAAIGGRIYAIGGSTTSATDVVSSANESYDPNTNSWFTEITLPTPRDMMGAAVANGNAICVIGGFKGSPSTFFQTNEIFSPPLFVHVKN